MASVERLGPGLYAFLCDCKYEKRKVTDSEVYFRCERPVEPKQGPCLKVHHLPTLLADLEVQEKRREAEKFMATHQKRLAEAKAVLGIKEGEDELETQKQAEPAVTASKKKPGRKPGNKES